MTTFDCVFPLTKVIRYNPNSNHQRNTLKTIIALTVTHRATLTKNQDCSVVSFVLDRIMIAPNLGGMQSIEREYVKSKWSNMAAVEASSNDPGVTFDVSQTHSGHSVQPFPIEETERIGQGMS
eukprot:2654793-Amphidinium_carterae.1